MEFVDLIQSIGFPFAMCVMLLYQNQKQGDRYHDDTNSLRGVLDENTKVLTKLYEHITKGESL